MMQPRSGPSRPVLATLMLLAGFIAGIATMVSFSAEGQITFLRQHASQVSAAVSFPGSDRLGVADGTLGDLAPPGDTAAGMESPVEGGADRGPFAGHSIASTDGGTVAGITLAGHTVSPGQTEPTPLPPVAPVVEEQPTSLEAENAAEEQPAPSEAENAAEEQPAPSEAENAAEEPVELVGHTYEPEEEEEKLDYTAAYEFEKDTGELRCVKSGYCSSGKVGVYVGEIDSTEGLKAALEATTYKKELVLVTIGSNGHQLGLNLAAGMWRLGMAHILLLANSEDSCQQLLPTYANISCAWSTRTYWEIPVGENTDMWARRYLIHARAVWMGYNVYNLDTDAYFFDDPYIYLKSAPFKDFQVISMRDGHEGGFINGGANYVQNARPGDAAGWVIAAVADRMIRVNENWAWFMDTHKVSLNHLGHAMMDQPVWSDIVATAKLGHPVFAYTMLDNYDTEAISRIDDAMQWQTKNTDFTYPKEWLLRSGVTEEKVVTFDLKVPNLEGTWDSQLGLAGFPTRKNYSLAFIETLKEESGGHLFDSGEGPDSPNDPTASGTWMMAPPWLLSLWSGRGVGGFWDLTPPMQVMVHLIFLPGAAPSGDKKEYYLKGHKAFHYDVPEALYNGKIFPTSTEERPLPRVLAMAPGITVHSESAEQYRAYLLPLLQLARRLDRVLLIPELSCTSPWIAEPPGSVPRLSDELSPYGYNHSMYSVHQTFYFRNNEEERCLWVDTINIQCMRLGQYMVLQDFEELLGRLRPKKRVATAKNTAWHEIYAGSRAAGGPAAGEEGEPEPLSVSGGEALELLQRYDSQPVVYIGTPLKLWRMNKVDKPEGEREEWQRFKDECEWVGPAE